MQLNYFYGQQSNQFTFYRIPKLSFTNARFKEISLDFKLRYGIMLDRMSLSAKNGWQDDKLFCRSWRTGHGVLEIHKRTEEDPETVEVPETSHEKEDRTIRDNIDLGYVHGLWHGSAC